jgi:hypothetical protein
MVIDQNVAMIVVHRVIDQQVVHTETAIHVHLRDQVPIVQPVAHTVTEIHVHLQDHLPIVHVAKTHTVAIAHAQAMIAMPVHLRVTANAVADQIGPEVVSPMIVKNVHAVALAKSA